MRLGVYRDELLLSIAESAHDMGDGHRLTMMSVGELTALNVVIRLTRGVRYRYEVT